MPALIQNMVAVILLVAHAEVILWTADLHQILAYFIFVHHYLIHRTVSACPALALKQFKAILPSAVLADFTKRQG